MSKSLMISLLGRANTGADILSVLDMIVSDIEVAGIEECASVFATPTLEEVAF